MSPAGPVLRVWEEPCPGADMSISRIAALVFAGSVASLVAPRLLAAQSAQRWAIQGSGIGVVPGGTAYEGLSSGFGAEAQVRFTPSAFSVGAGFQYSSHDLEFDDGSKETVGLSGGFLEPRYVIDVRSGKLAPYLSARLAILSQKATVEDFDLSATGFQINGGGGMLVRVSHRINLDFGVTFGRIHFEDVVIQSGGQTFEVTGSSGSGTNLVLRIGAAIGLGR